MRNALSPRLPWASHSSSTHLCWPRANCFMLHSNVQEELSHQADSDDQKRKESNVREFLSSSRRAMETGVSTGPELGDQRLKALGKGASSLQSKEQSLSHS